MKEILLSKPCCGSCGYFGGYYKCHGCSRYKMAEVYARDKACEAYVPRYPIKVMIEKEKGEK